MIKWRWQAQHCFWKRLTDWEKGTITRMPQDDALATHAPMIHKETGHIDWSKGGQQIIDLMRGMYPGHGAYAVLGEEPLKMFWAEAENKSYPAAAFGEIVEVTKKGLCGKMRRWNFAYQRGAGARRQEDGGGCVSAWA